MEDSSFIFATDGSIQSINGNDANNDGESRIFAVGPATFASAQDRVFNFAVGPATLPENVLLKAESELYNWHGAGMSVMEMSHRGKEFLSIIQKAESDLRKLLDISEDYAVLFLQGGATTQFAGIPLNICKPDDPVDYIVNGSWGDKAFKEASKYCKPKVIWSGKSEKYTGVVVICFLVLIIYDLIWMSTYNLKLQT